MDCGLTTGGQWDVSETGLEGIRCTGLCDIIGTHDTGLWDDDIRTSWCILVCMTGLGLDLSLAAGLRMPDDPRTLTGLGVERGEDTDDVELAGLMGTVDGA